MACTRDHNREASLDDAAAMAHAADLARSCHPHPNPRVGAVVLDASGAVVGCGAHLQAGEAHAEIHALTAAGPAAAGGTLVVTLEPCNHHGRTPPCTEAVLAAGIGRVVVGAADPDRLGGGGLARLRGAGIEVEVLPDPAPAEAIDPGYFHHRRTGRPLVTVKLAVTLDGQAAAADGSSQWITGDEARRDAHRLRAGCDAVIDGAGTLRHDDPRLDVRLEGFAGPQPRPVVVAGGGELPAGAQLWQRRPLVYSPAPRHLGVEVETVTLGGAGRVDPAAVVGDLERRGMLTLLVEGGPALASAFVTAGLADRIVIYFGALLGGGPGRPALGGAFATLGDALPVVIEDLAMVGPDVRLVARPAGKVA